MNPIIDIKVPDIGDFDAVPVIDLLVKAGDSIKIDDTIVTLESDKATMDVPASAGGIILEVLVKVGDRVSAGSPLLRIEQPAPPPPEPAAAQEKSGMLAAEITREDETNALATPLADTVATPPLPAPARGGNAHAAPSVRRLARELGVDLARVRASGDKGRIAKEDVIAHVKAAMQTSVAPASTGGGMPIDLLPWPTIDFGRFGPVERHARSRIQKLSAANLHRNWVMMPHVTNFDEADITDLEDFRQRINAEQSKDGPKITLLAFLIKAAVHTLQAHPTFNASLDGDEIVHKRYWHIGFAVDTPNGLVVPVIRDADRKSLLEIARETSELAFAARQGKLRPEQMQGGSFTVSSLGGIGGTGFTPIINAPEVAILGVTRSTIRPQWNGKEFVPRLMLPLCLSWDHRAVDGAAAARFLVHLSTLLADFRRTLL